MVIALAECPPMSLGTACWHVTSEAKSLRPLFRTTKLYTCLMPEDEQWKSSTEPNICEPAPPTTGKGLCVWDCVSREWPWRTPCDSASTFSGNDFKKSSTSEDRCWPMPGVIDQIRCLRNAHMGEMAGSAKLQNCHYRAGVDKIPSLKIETQHGLPPEPCTCSLQHWQICCSANWSSSNLMGNQQSVRSLRQDPRVVKVKVMKSGNVIHVVWKVCMSRTTSQRTKPTKILVEVGGGSDKKNQQCRFKKVKRIDKLPWNSQVETSAWQDGAEMNKVSITQFQCAKRWPWKRLQLHLAQRDNVSNPRPQQPLALAVSSCDPHGWCFQRPTRCVSSTHLKGKTRTERYSPQLRLRASLMEI